SGTRSRVPDHAASFGISLLDGAPVRLGHSAVFEGSASGPKPAGRAQPTRSCVPAEGTDGSIRGRIPPGRNPVGDDAGPDRGAEIRVCKIGDARLLADRARVY